MNVHSQNGFHPVRAEGSLDWLSIWGTVGLFALIGAEVLRGGRAGGAGRLGGGVGSRCSTSGSEYDIQAVSEMIGAVVESPLIFKTSTL